jgi:hypothetical protein
VLGDFIFTKLGGLVFSKGDAQTFLLPLLPLVVCKTGKTLDPEWQPRFMDDAVDIPELGARFVLLLLLLLLSMLVPAQLNSFTHLRTQLVLHGRGILAHATSVAGHYSSY